MMKFLWFHRFEKEIFWKSKALDSTSNDSSLFVHGDLSYDLIRNNFDFLHLIGQVGPFFILFRLVSNPSYILFLAEFTRIVVTHWIFIGSDGFLLPFSVDLFLLLLLLVCLHLKYIIKYLKHNFMGRRFGRL